jgi:ubiquinone/menaquinone biosynthesis C-methylase UbiE
MPKDYVAKTIEAYNNAPGKFAFATKEMVNYPEIETMLKYVPYKNAPILDVGCGFGRDSEVLAKKGFKTIGIDMSKALLKKAHELYPDLSFAVMDVRNLDFADNTFAAAWCNAVLLHLNDQDLAKALREILRVLTPGGVIAVSFKEGTGQKEVVEKFSSELARFYNFKIRDQLDEILKQIGFIVKESYTFNERDRFGPNKRDLIWVWSFAIKEDIESSK